MNYAALEGSGLVNTGVAEQTGTIFIFFKLLFYTDEHSEAANCPPRTLRKRFQMKD